MLCCGVSVCRRDRLNFVEGNVDSWHSLAGLEGWQDWVLFGNVNKEIRMTYKIIYLSRMTWKL